ncbi:LuxR C-terminal-related transcriptional regulator [Streptomyces sp. NBC_01239]|uniref:helix-turn-helix transcriptional regulator n=1 Tax=Streptomyces sp. NBC_01239 TaxID=2903792 RepID=UPI00338D4F6B
MPGDGIPAAAEIARHSPRTRAVMLTAAGLRRGSDRHQSPAHARRIAGPTPAERDVLRLLDTGLPNPEIAAQLHPSTGTVKPHISSILTSPAPTGSRQRCWRRRQPCSTDVRHTCPPGEHAMPSAHVWAMSTKRE